LRLVSGGPKLITALVSMLMHALLTGRLVNVKDADAHLTVICPTSGLCGEMKHRIFNEKIVDVYHDRLFSGEEDLDEVIGDDSSSSGQRKKKPAFDMVLTAIDDADLSRQICEMCRERRIPVNVADVPPECDFYFGSLIRRGPLQVMVSTGGKGPKIASQTRQVIERAIPENIGDAIERVGILRGMLRKVAPDQKQSPRRMKWMISVCENWSLDQLSEMNDNDMKQILAGWEKGTVPTYAQVRGRALPLGLTIPTSKQIKKDLFGVCPVVGFVSPWLSGILGLTAGAAAASAVFLLRSKGH
jgi:precorrin-2 dehydrogenase / sirohydrochlorin ferrochelatase